MNFSKNLVLMIKHNLIETLEIVVTSIKTENSVKNTK